jgi:hypothetical protein
MYCTHHTKPYALSQKCESINHYLSALRHGDGRARQGREAMSFEGSVALAT